jgi:hypothetical protein
VFLVRNDITCSKNCKYSKVATLYTVGTWHKCDNSNEDNNNNDRFVVGRSKYKFSQYHHRRHNTSATFDTAPRSLTLRVNCGFNLFRIFI